VCSSLRRDNGCLTAVPGQVSSLSVGNHPAAASLSSDGSSPTMIARSTWPLATLQLVRGCCALQLAPPHRILLAEQGRSSRHQIGWPVVWWHPPPTDPPLRFGGFLDEPAGLLTLGRGSGRSSSTEGGRLSVAGPCAARSNRETFPAASPDSGLQADRRLRVTRRGLSAAFLKAALGWQCPQDAQLIRG